VAAAQILFMELPNSAAVNLGVAAVAAQRTTQRFKGFANAVLRRIGREKAKLLEKTVPNASVMPQWLRQQVRSDFGRQNLAQMEAMILLEPYLDISIKAGHSSAQWKKKLEAEVLVTGSLRLTSSTPVHRLEGYNEGTWWVQNAAAAIAARLFGNVEGKSIADLCAAPGGKSAQLASSGAIVTAVDSSKLRLSRLVENFERLELEAEIVCADILAWDPGRAFDCVLLDAPCTSTGTMRRHPDVMWSKTAQDVNKLAELQYHMLQKAIAITKSGGTIIFATCSIAKAEGEDIFARIVRECREVKNLSVSAEEVGGLSEIINRQGAVRCLPHHLALEPQRLGGLDGFFIARLEKM